ncbi:MAG TPA: 6-carboxytetrahydropterin synthase [Pseudonocardiaceae bacterium]|nr:6-carboxytetrahydropterin synthase [Pseudonocardiaceae bacterium]
MITTLEMARAEFGFYAAHIALYNGEAEPLHGHTFQVALRVSGEPDASGMVAEFSTIRPAMRDAVAPLRRRTLVPGHAPELRITPDGDSLSITCGRKRYLLPAEDVTVLPLVNTTLEALAGHLLSQVLPQLRNAGLVAAELEISELPGTLATARADLS